MDAQQHSTVREGAVTGLIGAVIVAVWHFVVDTVAGQPLHTPNVLGKILLRGNLTPASGIAPQPVIGFTVLHFVLYVLIGIGLVVLVHLAVRDISLRMGVWIGLVISGSVLGVLGMAGYLWRGHPRLRRSFKEAPLGSEVQPPPHPPERPWA